MGTYGWTSPLQSSETFACEGAMGPVPRSPRERTESQAAGGQKRLQCQGRGSGAGREMCGSAGSPARGCPCQTCQGEVFQCDYFERLGQSLSPLGWGQCLWQHRCYCCCCSCGTSPWPSPSRLYSPACHRRPSMAPRPARPRSHWCRSGAGR